MFKKLFSIAAVIAIALFVTSTAFARHSHSRHHFHSVKLASSVTPTVVAGNPADCTTGTAQHPGLGITGATTLNYGSSKSGTGTAPGVTITVSTPDGITFDFSAVLPAGEKILAVLAKGGSQGGNLYDYRPAGGVLSDSGLHPPPTGNGSQFAGISHILFCYGTPSSQGSNTGNPPPGPGNGGGSNNGGTTNGGTTNNTSGTSTPGVTVTAPSKQGTPPKGTQHTAPSKQKVKAKKVKHRASRRPLRRAGFTG
jgi:hypothetical protein